MAEDKPSQWRGLTPEETNKIRTWITTHWAHQNCPYCERLAWNPASFLVAPTTIANNSVQVFGGPGTYALAMVFCGYCGHTVFLNAQTLGLISLRA
jgi:hypothetical protein